MAISDWWETKAMFWNISYTHSHNTKTLSLRWTFSLYSQRKTYLSAYLKPTASFELWTHDSSGSLLPQDIASSSFSSISASFSLFLSTCYSLYTAESPVFDSIILSNFPSSFLQVNFSGLWSLQILLPAIPVLAFMQAGCCCLADQLCLTLATLSGSSIHGISQARILEWVAISFSRGSSRPRDGIHVSWMSSELQADSFLISHLGRPIQAGVCSQIRLIRLLAEQIAFSALRSVILDLCCVAPLTSPSCVIVSPTLIIIYQILVGGGGSSPILLNCSLAIFFNVSFSSCSPKCKDSLGTFF